MSYLDRIAACNNFNAAEFLPFHIASQQVGWVRPAFASRLRDWPDYFNVSDHGVALRATLDSFEARSAALQQVNAALFERGIIQPRATAELYSVTAGEREQAFCTIERAAAAHYGIRAFGQHINGYVRDGDRLLMWVGVRAKDKPNEPGKLDQIVAGGLPHGLSEMENILKESAEEADIPVALAGRARATGYISYFAQTADGAKPDTMLCYDLELPAHFEPRCTDGEVERFMLLPIDEIATRVRETLDFKMNCNLVIIDFLIRHERLNPATPEFKQIRDALRPALS